MAIIPGVVVDWRLSPRVITLPIAVTSIAVEDLQDTLLDLEAQETDGILFPHLRNTSGGEALGGGVSVGFTMELQDAVTAFAPRTLSASSGTVTAFSAGGVALIDGAATFISDGVLPGASVINFFDRSVSSVISVDSETQLTCYGLADGTDNQWDIGDAYKVWNEIQCEVTGGNIVAVSSLDAPISPIRATFGTQVVKTSSSSATTQEQLDIQQMSFRGGVLLDSLNGVTGQDFPIGTGRSPSDNLSDSRAILTFRGLTTLLVRGSFTFGATDILDGVTVKGDSAITFNVITLTPGVSTEATHFSDVTLAGTLSGRIDGTGVVFRAITDMAYDSWLSHCWFEGDVALKGGGHFVVVDGGISSLAGVIDRPNFDYAQVPIAMTNFLRWSGNIGFKGVSSGTIDLNMDSGSGDVFIDSSNTGGIINVSPNSALVYDQSNGVTVIGGAKVGLIVSDPGNTSSSFKTDLVNTVTGSLIDVLITFLTGALAGQVKQARVYNGITKIVGVTGAYTGIPAAGDRFKIGSE